MGKFWDWNKRIFLTDEGLEPGIAFGYREESHKDKNGKKIVDNSDFGFTFWGKVFQVGESRRKVNTDTQDTDLIEHKKRKVIEMK